ncbi:YueI family protein [Aciduricibacillus chroicocephali]|uniref:YueI family protein n=1 Tax=Aciduricibacillus chroicocephali TaxID=3054939 RepID=A0ABY9KVZ8_9BACI|nr:YueI family protein [Bacillaceae bacterium 44XB]
MSGKSTEDYIKEGIYGTKLPKQGERDRFLGTLRERILLALTTGQVMKGKGLVELEREMNAHPDASLLLNGEIAHQYFKDIKAAAKKNNIPFTSITNEEKNTDIGAVLTLDKAIDRENIFLQEKEPALETNNAPKQQSLLKKIKSWLS